MKDIAIILGIRPDVIRASKILKKLKSNKEIQVDFIWSGQHYSSNMKDIFFKQLNTPKPDFEFELDTKNDSTIVSSVISQTYNHLENHKYKGVVFLGDTNTVMGSIAVAQQNIPIVHIEGCMRSYDWRMPEEKYRKTIDHLSDRIYAYLENYKKQGLNEGISESIIKVTTNPIVDIINDNLDLINKGQEYLDDKILDVIKNNEFIVVTCHRRENIFNLDTLKKIINLINASKYKVIFPVGYATQRQINNLGLQLNDNVTAVDPIGYLEFMYLLKNSKYCITDSGTVVEEACILGVPSIQMRYSTERPEVYEVKSSIKFDPLMKINEFGNFHLEAEKLLNTNWKHPFGDGNASEIIVEDLIDLIMNEDFNHHKKENYDFDISRSFSK